MKFAKTVGITAIALLSLLSPVPGRAQNIINTVAGGGKVGGRALAADIAGPTGVVKDSKGNLYITGAGLYVFKVNPASDLSVYAGTGFGGIQGVGGPATSATLQGPAALALDSRDNLFIADSLSNHIWTVDASTGILTNVAGNATADNPLGGFSGDGGKATKAQLNTPQGVAVATNSDVYIADQANNRIRRVRNGIITTFAGDGTVCADPTTPCGDLGKATNAHLNTPLGVAVDASGNVFIADAGDQRIRRVDHKTNIITTVAGSGAGCVDPTQPCGDDGPATMAQLRRPRAVFVDTSGNLYIADTRDQKIRFVDAKTQVISTVAGTGNIGFSGDKGAAKDAELSFPGGVFVGPDGSMLIADSGTERIRAVTATFIDTIAGGGSGGDGHLATKAILAGPLAVVLDSSSNQFILDRMSNRIRRVDAKNGHISTVAGNGIAGYAGDGGDATQASINLPLAVVVDGFTNLFIADSRNNVVRRVDGTSKVITTYAGKFGSVCNPPPDSCGDGGAATEASLSFPAGVAVDAAGNLFISDAGDNRIRRVDFAKQIITTVAGDGNACPVSTDPCGDDGLATNAHLNAPFEIAVDGPGNIFIADSNDNRVRRVDAASGNISTVAFNGLPTFGGDGGLATDASYQLPLAMLLDAAGNLFVGGGFDLVVQRVDAATQTIATVVGNPKHPLRIGFSGDGGRATKATLNAFGMATDNFGGLFLADGGNNRVRYVHLTPTAIPSPRRVDFGNQHLHQTSSPHLVTLSNTGGDDLQIANIATTGDFAQTNDCGGLLAPALSCTISVTFTPKKLGVRSGTLTITDDGPNGKQKVFLTGTGVK